MKVGSLVECVKSPNKNLCEGFEDLPIVGIVYTVRELVVSPFTGNLHIRLEEIQNAPFIYNDLAGEKAFNAKNFREIQLPNNLESEITEALTRELVTI